MNENTGKVDVASDCDVCKKVYEVANVLQVSASNNVYRFASRTVADATDTLVTVTLADSKATISVNCEKMVIGSMLLKDLKGSLSS
jgi:AP-3 complex subunit beta